MNMPGFVAEASVYRSRISYVPAGCKANTERGITPQGVPGLDLHLSTSLSCGLAWLLCSMGDWWSCFIYNTRRDCNPCVPGCGNCRVNPSDPSGPEIKDCIDSHCVPYIAFC